MNCLDGSGPIPPVPVTCEFLPDGRNLTYIAHEQMESTKVIIIIVIIILIRRFELCPTIFSIIIQGVQNKGICLVLHNTKEICRLKIM